MLRLLRIEFLKVKAYKTFWVFLILYALLIILVSTTAKSDTIATESIFSFPHIWLNLARMASFLNILLGILIILLISNEFTFKTFRQNIIDGLSREQAVTSKFVLIKGIALVCVLFLFTYGMMIRGLAAGHFDHLEDVFSELHFLLRLFLQMVGYMGIAALIAFLIRKSALSIVVYIVFIAVEYIFQSRIPDEIERYLPIHAFGSLLPPIIQLGAPTVEPLSTGVLVGLTIVYFLLCLTASRLLMQRSAI